MKLLKAWAGALAALVAFTCDAHAAERKPLVIGASGQQQQLQATDTLKLPASTTANASLNLPHGTAPTSPTNGDCWTTTSGLYCRINGATVGPLGSGGGSPGGSSGQVQYNNAGAFGGFTVSGDGTLNTATGALTVTKTGGASFGYFATGTDAANLTGTVSVNRFNSGTGASSSTYLRGDGTWASVSGSGITQLTGDVTAGPGSGSQAATLANSGVAANTYGSSSQVPVITVDAKGRVTSLTTTTVSGGGGGTSAMDLLSEVITSGTQSTVTFSSIPAGYRDLIIRVRARNTASATSAGIYLRFNSDSGNNYYNITTYASGSASTAGANSIAANASAGQIGMIPAATATASFPVFAQVIIGDYRSTTFYKSMRSIYNAYYGINNITQIFGDLGSAWANTAAITSVQVLFDNGAFVNGSVVSLYGSL